MHRLRQVVPDLVRAKRSRTGPPGRDPLQMPI